jgi:hypothetical protein
LKKIGFLKINIKRYGAGCKPAPAAIGFLKINIKRFGAGCKPAPAAKIKI